MVLFAVLAVVKATVVDLHCASAHTHAAETSVVEEVLHGYLFGEVGEECNAIIRALLCCCVA